MVRDPEYYTIVPAQLQSDKRLKATEKILYADILTLSNKNGYCHARNAYFANRYGVENRTIQRWIQNLRKFGYLTEQQLKNSNGQFAERRIIPQVMPRQKTTEPILPAERQKCPAAERQFGHPPHDKFVTHNNTRENKQDHHLKQGSKQEQSEKMMMIPFGIQKKCKDIFGPMSKAMEKQLMDAVQALGEPLTDEILNRCIQCGAHKWAYVNKALSKAIEQGVHSVDEYNGSHARETGQIVDRETPSGNNILWRALNRPIKLKRTD